MLGWDATGDDRVRLAGHKDTPNVARIILCVSRQVHSGNVHNGTGRAAHPLRTSLRGESLQWKIQGGTVSARLLS